MGDIKSCFLLTLNQTKKPLLILFCNHAIDRGEISCCLLSVLLKSQTKTYGAFRIEKFVHDYVFQKRKTE